MNMRIKQLQTELHNRQAEEDAKKKGQQLESQYRFLAKLELKEIYHCYDYLSFS